MAVAAVAVVPVAAASAQEAAPQAQTPWPADAVAGALLVTLAAGVPVTVLEELGAEVAASAVRSLTERAGVIDVMPGREAAAAADLYADPRVAAVEPDRLRHLDRLPNDPEYRRQWSHQQAGAEAAWDVTVGDRDVLVAIIDSGIRADHPDLAPNIVEQVDVSTGSVVLVGPGVDNDACATGHGTQVAGVLAAVGDNDDGVAGVAWEVGIVDVAVTGSGGEDARCGAVADSAVIAGLRHVRTRAGGAVDVVSLSLGSPATACPLAYQTEIGAARAAGIVVVASAGNRELSMQTAGSAAVPASCDGVLSVGATDRSGLRTDYSSVNQWVDLLAPGGSAAEAGSCDAAPEECILTTARDGGLRAVEGTSYAAPYVAGVAALLRTVRPELAPDQVAGVLERSVRDVGAIGRDDGNGWGALDAGAALALAAAGDPVAVAGPTPSFPVARRNAAILPAPGPGPSRVAAADITEPITQAVAVSRATFADSGAAHAVLARADAFPDALAGAALGLGAGPLLFTPSRGPLADPTRAELARVLAEGATVYLLGGDVALPAELEDELVALGFSPLRLAGDSRAGTAAKVADAVRARLPELGVADPRAVLLVTADNWPDAVSAGALGATIGAPILLSARATLDPATRSALERIQPDLLYIVGGQGVISDATAAAAQSAAGLTESTRLAGPNRAATAIAVARELDRIQGPDTPPALAVVANYDRAVEGFAHVLSGSALLGAHTGVLVPVLGSDGAAVVDVVEEYLTGLPPGRRTAVALGGPDLVPETTLEHIAALLHGGDVQGSG